MAYITHLQAIGEGFVEGENAQHVKGPFLDAHGYLRRSVKCSFAAVQVKFYRPFISNMNVTLTWFVCYPQYILLLQ